MMLNNLAFHGKLTTSAESEEDADDKKTLCLKEAMANWEVGTYSDSSPASIRPLAKKPLGRKHSTT